MNNNLITLDTRTGTESANNESATLYAYHLGEDRTRERTMDAAYRENVIRPPAGRTREAAFGGLPMEVGSWTSARWMVPEGHIVKLYADRTRHRKAFQKACVYLLMREDAPLQRISLELTCAARSNFRTAYAEGRFDILTEGELISYGVVVPEMYAPFSCDEFVMRTFDVEVLAPAKTVRTVKAVRTEEVTNRDGDTVTISTHRTVRKIARRGAK